MYMYMHTIWRVILWGANFMVDLAITKFPTHEKWYYYYYYIPVLRESMMMGMAKNIVAVRPTLLSVNK